MTSHRLRAWLPTRSASVRLGIASGLALATVSLLGSASPGLATAPSSRTLAATTPVSHAVVATRVYGHSVNGHVLRAFEVGNRSAPVTVVALAAMHGNETGGSVILNSLRDGLPVRGVNLWVIPRDNPDGVLSNDRHNADGVDLNRNFPAKWIFQRGYYYSGPHPSSEPETRGLERLLNRVDPDFVVTFHSPLHGVDAYQSKDRAFAHRLARDLALPIKSFDCNGGCHGTLTQWFNNRHDGACVTVELGSDPSSHYVNVRAPRGLLRAIGGRR